MQKINKKKLKSKMSEMSYLINIYLINLNYINYNIFIVIIHTK